MGNYIDNYKKRVKPNNELYKKSTEKFIDNTISDSPFYNELTIDDGYDNYILFARISEVNDKTIRNLIFNSGTKVLSGSIVEWNDKKWIITEFNDNTTYPKAKMELANSSIKWLHDNIIHETACIYQSIRFNTDDYKNMSIGAGRRRVVCQFNDVTMSISRNSRFIFDNRAWRIFDIDRISVDGIITMTIEEDQVNEFDNMELRVADYNVKTADDVNSDNYTIEIQGLDRVRTERETTYNILVLQEDGTPFYGLNMNISILDSNGNVSTDYATILNVDLLSQPQKVTVKTKSNLGQFRLRAMLVSNPSVFTVKTIEVISLF